MRARLGVDIGGTFTDLVVIDDATGTARVGKVLTTAKDPAHGVEEGIHALLDEAGVRSDAVRAVVHGTTLATNALIERKGAKTALLTTEGFRDASRSGARAGTTCTTSSSTHPRRSCRAICAAKSPSGSSPSGSSSSVFTIEPWAKRPRGAWRKVG